MTQDKTFTDIAPPGRHGRPPLGESPDPLLVLLLAPDPETLNETSPSSADP